MKAKHFTRNQALAAILTVLLLSLSVPFSGLADVYDPMTWDTVTGYTPAQDAYLPDYTGYHDDSIDVTVERFRENDTNVYVARIGISDPSQLRTYTAGKYPSKTTAPVGSMSKRVGAVIAMNGDYFSYHSEGVVMRNGTLYRNKPTIRRDTLIIDENGDFEILTATTKEAWEAHKEKAIHVFSFGPGLVVDGEKISEDRLREVKLDFGKDRKTQRIALCQTGHLSYMIVCVEGPEQKDSVGFTCMEFADLCYRLGAINAYNLDGGSSSSLVLNNKKINAVGGKVRCVGDMIWFATLESDR